MRRTSLLGGLLLACNPASPAADPPQPAKAAPIEAPPSPVAAPPPVQTPPAVPPTPAPEVADSSGQPRYRALPPPAVEELWKTLPVGRGVAYPPQVGPFGPAPDGVLVLHVDDAGHLAGFVDTRVDGAATRVDLPPLNWAMNTVRDILFEDVDGDGRDEAIILVTAMTGIGPTAAEEFSATHVIQWSGKEFVAMPELERKIGRATSAAEVRRALQASKPR